MGKREEKKQQFAKQEKKSGKAVWIVIAVALVGAAVAVVLGVNPA